MNHGKDAIQSSREGEERPKPTTDLRPSIDAMGRRARHDEKASIPRLQHPGPEKFRG